MRWLARILLTALVVFATAAMAAPVKTLVWEDLAPKFPDGLRNPLAAMGLYQQLELETILWARSLSEQERKSEDEKASLEDAAHFERTLLSQGVDVDKLLRQYKAWQKEVEERGQQLVPALNGKKVKLAGYLLPLEFSEEGQTEFLLVPYVGACIHAPVPPPNQIVFVEVKQPFKSEALFAAVWVTGTMRTKMSSKALNFVDGSADIPLGYTLSDGQIKIYTE